MAFKKAVKRDAKLRLALCGPAGSGKTMTLLKVATALGGPIAYVDTEHGSASKYAHTDTCGGPGVCEDSSHFDFDVVEPKSFDPRELGGFIDEAVAGGYRVICADSLSHYWMGPGGELDLVDAKAKTERGNSFAAWKTVTPYHNALVDKMISAPIHVLVAMRTKTEWVVEKDDKGKNIPRKIGTAPIMRDGIEFEFDVCGDLDQDNNLAITKTRCSALAGKVINRPGAEMAATLNEWLAGAPPAPAPPELPSERPVPTELVGMFERIDKDIKSYAGGFGMLQDEACRVGGTVNGMAAVERVTKAFRAAVPKGTETKGQLKDCLVDLWLEIQKLESVAEPA